MPPAVWMTRILRRGSDTREGFVSQTPGFLRGHLRIKSRGSQGGGVRPPWNAGSGAEVLDAAVAAARVAGTLLGHGSIDVTAALQLKQGRFHLAGSGVEQAQ